jgi:MFS family permease
MSLEQETTSIASTIALTASDDISQSRWNNNNNRGEEHYQNESDIAEEAAMPMTPSMSWIERRHYTSTAAMCLCTFTHSWLLVSVFPYSGFMVIKLVSGTDEENAGSYAGLLAASFMIGRAITSYGWGRIADIYGRRIVFFVSLVLSALFSILFGLSSSFRFAFFWRFLLGASNGVAGISKVVVSETSEGNEKLETKGMSLSMGMWAWGFLLSPAISGFLSDPIRQYPDLSIWTSLLSSQEKRSPIYQFLELHPFFLPNLISVLLCLIGLIAVAFWVPETLPSEDLRSAAKIPADFSNWLAATLAGNSANSIGIDENSIDSSSTNTTNNVEMLLNEAMIHGDDLAYTESESLFSTSAIELQPTQNKYRNDAIPSTSSNNNIHGPSEVVSLSYLWSKTDTRNHLIVFWIFSFVAIAIDEAFPLYCISKTGGLGLSEKEIGKLLSATGLIFAVSQYNVYGWIVDRFGLRRSIQLGALLSAPLVTFVPISILFNNASEDHEKSEDPTSLVNNSSLSWTSFIYLSLLLSFIRIFGLVFFSSIAIATNRTVVPSHRGTMNGLSMLGGSVAKGLGPIFAGLLVSSGISSGVFAPKVGAAIVFVVIGACSAITAGIIFCLLVENKSNDHNIPYHTNNERESECDCDGSGIESINDNNNAFQQPLLGGSIVHRHSKKTEVI